MTLRQLLGRIYRGLTASSYSPLRPVAESIKFYQRMGRVRKGLLELRGIPEGEPVELSHLARIREAWGNPGWAADAGFLLEVGSAIRSRPGPVLDCGSGLTTVICAALAERHGATVWSLEQDRDWYEYMRRVIEALHLDNVRLWHTPLRTFGDFVWFDLGTIALPPHFSVVSCDGPAVRQSAFPPDVCAAWRVGVVLVLKSLSVSFDEILLDDVEDLRSTGLAERWLREGLATTVVETPTGKLLRGYGKTS
jgi:hypothetical protein